MIDVVCRHNKAMATVNGLYSQHFSEQSARLSRPTAVLSTLMQQALLSTSFLRVTEASVLRSKGLLDNQSWFYEEFIGVLTVSYQ